MAITKGTFVDFVGADAGATSVASSSFDSTGNGLLIAAAGWEDVNSSGLNFTDNKGNTWQAAVVEDGGGAAAAHIAVGWCVPTTVGSGHVVTCNFGASVPVRRIAVLPANGNFSVADAIAATTQQAQGALPDPAIADAGSLTTSVAALLIQAVIDYNSIVSTAGSGWTKDSATAGRHFQSRLESSGGTFDPVMTMTGGEGHHFATIAMAFKETSGVTNADGLPSGVSASGGVGTAIAQVRPPPPYTLTTVTG